MNAFAPGEENADFADPELINLSWPGAGQGLCREKLFPISPAGLTPGERKCPGLFFPGSFSPGGKRTHTCSKNARRTLENTSKHLKHSRTRSKPLEDMAQRLKTHENAAERSKVPENARKHYKTLENARTHSKTLHNTLVNAKNTQKHLQSLKNIRGKA